MTKKKRSLSEERKAAETVKTSVKLPRSLWRKARIRAIDDDTELQEIIARALEAYLKEDRG